MGGAEALCAALGRALVADGSSVTILTTCAADNRSWQNALPEGHFDEDGLKGIRFLADTRDLERWIPLQLRLTDGSSLDIEEQCDWFSNTVHSTQLLSYLAQHSKNFDLIISAPYLLGTTFWGAMVDPSRSVIIPCLHDEPAAYLPSVGAMLRLVRGVIFHASAEAKLAERLHGPLKGGVVGMGFESISIEVEEGLKPFFSMEESYVLCLGRKETGKNVHLLIDFFTAWKDSRPNSSGVKLVICGGGSFSDLHRPAALERDDIVDIGHVSEEEKLRLIKHSLCLIQPSVNESFSIVLMEAWRLGAPVVVNGFCPVTKDHVETSGGGLFFTDSDDFSSVMDTITTNDKLRRMLGEAGRRYVLEQYSWSAVLTRFNAAIEYIFSSR
jgi:glycosyltransferase involved in cell wall biosynthesis